MATRGYIHIVSPESKDDFYFTPNDILLEAWHDGYDDGLIKDILNVPFKIFEMNEAGFGKQIMSPKWRKMTINQREYADPEELLDLWETCLPYQFSWNYLVECLHFTVPFKYNQIDPGTLRYHSPVGFESASYKITVAQKHLKLKVTIEVLADLWFEEDEAEIKALVLEHIEELNRQIYLPKYHITVRENCIIHDPVSILANLFWNKDYNQKDQ